MESSGLNPVLIVVIVIFAIFILKGLIKGFWSMIFFVVALAMCVFLSGLLVNPVSDFLKNTTGLYDALKQPVYTKVLNDKSIKEQADYMALSYRMGADDKIQGDTLYILSENANTVAAKINVKIEDYNLPARLKKQLYVTQGDVRKELETEDVTIKKLIAGLMAAKVAFLLLEGIVYIILFIAIYIIIRIIFHLLNVFSKVPVLSGINRLLGMGVGLFEGYLLVCAGFTVLNLLGVTGLGQEAFKLINGNSFLKAINDNNLLTMMLFKFNDATSL